MKNILLTVFGLFAFAQTYGQGLEVSVQANAAFFHYAGGIGTAAFYGGGPPYVLKGWGNYLWGSNIAFGYCAGLQVQYVTKIGFIAGLQPAYEVLRSDENLVNPGNYSGSIIGHFYFQTNYINLNPYLGYRFKIHRIKIDLMVGIDRAFDGKAHGYGSAFYEGHSYQINTSSGGYQNDTRARFGITAWYKRVGLTASYSAGLTNFNSGDNLTPFTVYSEVIRMGVCYRIL